MSSFQISATTVTFTVNQDNFSERKDNPVLRTWDLELFLALASDYTALIGLVSGPITVRLCRGSAGITADIAMGGGPGPGTLTIDNVIGSPFNAALTHLDRPSAYPGGGRRCRASFQETI
jgi:hypothetical protein